MAERGNTTHGPHLDDKMKQETQGAVKGNQPAHAEEWRESEPFPDDTDPAEVREALDPAPGSAPSTDEEVNP
jgi:hypothetical protein